MAIRKWKLLAAGLVFAGATALTNGAFADDQAQAASGSASVNRVFNANGQNLTDQVQPVAFRQCGDAGCTTCGCGDIGCGDLGCGEGCDDLYSCEEDSGFSLGCVDFGGWVQAGYTSESTGMFNNIPDKVNFHQNWLYAEKVADGSEGLDWGFRADVMYGVDGTDTQAFGNNPGRWDFINGFDFGPYSWAIPQLYAEVANGDFSVKLGHFYTLLGYEVVGAPDNFFFSHAMTMYNSEAFTHTGVLGTYSASDDLTLYGGWTLGWDTGFDQFNNGSNFLGGFSTAVGEDATFTYITTFGQMGVRGNGYSHSCVLDVALTDNLNYVLQSDLVDFKIFGGRNNEVGINQYLLYSINDMLGVGARVEWWKSDAGFNHGGQSLPLGGSVSYYEATFGVNIKPTDNVIIRPEYRHDWFPAGNGSYTNDIFGVDAIITF